MVRSSSVRDLSLPLLKLGFHQRVVVSVVVQYGTTLQWCLNGSFARQGPERSRAFAKPKKGDNPIWHKTRWSDSMLGAGRGGKVPGVGARREA